MVLALVDVVLHLLNVFSTETNQITHYIKWIVLVSLTDLAKGNFPADSLLSDLSMVGTS